MSITEYAIESRRAGHEATYERLATSSLVRAREALVHRRRLAEVLHEDGVQLRLVTATRTAWTAVPDEEPAKALSV